MPRKSRFKDSLILTGELFANLSIKLIFSYFALFAGVLLGWVLVEAKVHIFPSIIMTIVIGSGTGISALVFKTVTLAIGKLLIWIGNSKVKRIPAKFDVSVIANSEEFYLRIANNEKWFKAKDVYIIWQYLATTPNVPGAISRLYEEWNRNNGILIWKDNDPNKKIRSIEINRKNFKDALLLQLPKDKNEFKIMAIDHDPFNLPLGGYIFHILIHMNLPRRFQNYKVLIDFEFKSDGQLEINKVEREVNS